MSAFDDSAVHVLGGVTADEYVRGNMLMVRRGAGRRIVPFSILFGVLALGLILGGELLFGVALGVYAIVIGSGWLHRRVFRRRYASDPRSAEMVQFRFDRDGFAMAGSGFESRYAWSRVDVAYEDDTMFVLMIGPLRGLSVPKRSFDPADLARFKTLLASSVRVG